MGLEFQGVALGGPRQEKDGGGDNKSGSENHVVSFDGRDRSTTSTKFGCVARFGSVLLRLVVQNETTETR